METSEFLKGVSLFSSLKDEGIKELLGHTQTVNYGRDAEICKEGDRADAMYIIKSGIVQIFCDDGHGGKKVLTHLKLGDYFGEMALFTEEPRSASAAALAETECLKLPKDALYKAIYNCPDIAIEIIRTISERLTRTNISAGKEKSAIIFTIMGPDTSSGKSLLARNLALALQELLKTDVLLFDPNVRDDRVARALGVDQRSHIIDELVERERLSNFGKYLVKTPCGLTTILPQENGLTDLRLKEFHTFILMKAAFEQFKFVVVDNSSMYTKVTKELTQISDKILYLISTKNISIGGLIDHFEETRRNWNVEPARVVYGINHNVGDPSKESMVTDRDRRFVKFELLYAQELHGRREADHKVLIQRHPDDVNSQAVRRLAEDVSFDQTVAILIPTRDDDPTKAEQIKQWTDTGREQLDKLFFRAEIKAPQNSEIGRVHVIEARAAKWAINQRVPELVALINEAKKQFGLERAILRINREQNLI